MAYDHLKIKEFVGVLMFPEYPSTMVYANQNENPLIKEWVDCSDDNKIDRYFYYNTTASCLKLFIEGEISHLELIKSATEGFVMLEDEEDGQRLGMLKFIGVDKIPKNYLPHPDCQFSQSDCQDLHKIIKYFKIETHA